MMKLKESSLSAKSNLMRPLLSLCETLRIGGGELESERTRCGVPRASRQTSRKKLPENPDLLLAKISNPSLRPARLRRRERGARGYAGDGATAWHARVSVASDVLST